MSNDAVEKIKQKAKLMEDDSLPSCWGKFVLLDDVLKILEVEREKLLEKIKEFHE